MAEAKRKFYNSGDAKGFTKKDFFETVAAIVEDYDGEVEANMVDLVAQAAAYELEGIANRPSKASGEKKNPLESDYAQELASKIIPRIGKEAQAKTAKQLVEECTKAGEVASKTGKPFAGPWVSRVLNATPGISSKKIIIDDVDSKGLKVQKEATAYFKA